MKKLVSILLVLCLLISCTACTVVIPDSLSGLFGSSDDNKTDTPEDPTKAPAQDPTKAPSQNPTDDPAKADLVEYQWDHLTYYLSKEFSRTDLTSYVMHSIDNVAIIVASDYLIGDITDAESFAQVYVDEATDNGISSQLYTKNGIFYTISDFGDSTMEYRGFYYHKGYGWNIYATTSNFTGDTAEIIDYVTSGVVDTTFQSQLPGQQPEDQPPVTDPPPTEPPTTEPAPEITPEPEDGTITIYTLVPDSWGNPGCWAWLNSTRENAYDAWPGVPMTWNGKFYEAQAPDWVDYIIINGLNGDIQTEDIPITMYRDIWVVIFEEGLDTYYLTFSSEPTTDELAVLGY